MLGVLCIISSPAHPPVLSMWVQNFQTRCAANQGHSKTWPAAPLAHLPLLFASGFMYTQSFSDQLACIQHTPISFSVVFHFLPSSLSKLSRVRRFYPMCTLTRSPAHPHMCWQRHETPGTTMKDFIALSTQVHVLLFAASWPAECPEWAWRWPW